MEGTIWDSNNVSGVINISTNFISLIIPTTFASVVGNADVSSWDTDTSYFKHSAT